MKSTLLTKIERILKKESIECYVLMLCNKSKVSEELFVEMSYEGDEVLGSYMLEKALSIMDNKIKQKNQEVTNDESLT